MEYFSLSISTRPLFANSYWLNYTHFIDSTSLKPKNRQSHEDVMHASVEKKLKIDVSHSEKTDHGEVSQAHVTQQSPILHGEDR